MNPRQELLARSHGFGMIQNEVEVKLFLDWYERQPIARVMEIGTHTGGFLFLLMNSGLPKKLVISVDLPWQAEEYQVGNFRAYAAGQVHFIVGNSHEPATMHRVGKLVDTGELDFLFLDGDHSFEGVKQDWIMYSGLVRRRGWIGFHDINNGHECGKFYWDVAIKDRPHVEFGYGRTFGIGCVQV